MNNSIDKLAQTPNTFALSCRGFILLCLVSLSLLAPRSVFAGGYLWDGDSSGQLFNPVWADPNGPEYHLSEVGYLNSDITNAQLETEIVTAIQTVLDMPYSLLSPSYAGQIGRVNGNADGPVFSGIDGINLITFADPDIIFNPETLAVCVLSYFPNAVVIDDQNNDLDGDGVADLANMVYPAGSIFDADIIFDGNKTFSVLGETGNDIQAVFLHELGHCTGLSHSSILSATMFPLINNDVAVARQLSKDDVTYLSRQYLNPSYSNRYSLFQGSVTSGSNGAPVVGAHVFAVNSTTNEQISGTYTLTDGSYELPVPSFDYYYIKIEPLDGDPVGLDPERINPIISNTSDRYFPEEFYSTVESNSDDPELAEQVYGSNRSNLNIITNLVEESGAYLNIESGINYFSYPLDVPDSLTAFDLLAANSGVSGINSLQRYNPTTGRFDQALLMNAQPQGTNFPIKRGEGYLLHSSANELIGFSGSGACPLLQLRKGLNIVGAPCAPAEYSAYNLLADIGDPVLINRVRRYDAQNGAWEEAYFDGNLAAGVDFPMTEGQAYVVEMHFPVADFRLNSSGQELPPIITSIAPGQGVIGSVVKIFGSGLINPLQSTSVYFNDIPAPVLELTAGSVTVTVPTGASDGTVHVDNGLISNSLPFDVLLSGLQEVEGQVSKVSSGQEVSAAIDTDGDVDVYEFVAVAGNLAKIIVRSETWHQPELNVTLWGPNGEWLANANTIASRRVLFNNFPLTQSGRHRITVEGMAGTGGYTVAITLIGVATTPRIDVIGGDAQTTVGGTRFSEAFELLAVASNGLPSSNVAVTLTMEAEVPVDSGNEGLSNKAASVTKSAPSPQSFTATTASDGIITLDVNAPSNEAFVYFVTITAPGMQPATMFVSVIENSIAQMLIEGDDQNCGGAGCPVDEVLPEELSITFTDAQGEPIKDVFVHWSVISGEGKIKKDSLEIEMLAARSKDDGKVTIEHKLGSQLYFDYDVADPAAPLIEMPQQIAVVVPEQAAPIVFTADAKAGDVSNVIFAASNYTNLSLGTVVFNAIKMFAVDAFNNPVPNVTVVTSSPTGLNTYPGIYNGIPFSSSQTNERGFYVAAVSAPGGQVAPTYDEFGNSGTPGLGGVHVIQVQIPAAGVSKLFVSEVDMGPVLTSEGQGASALIGQVVGAQLRSELFRVQRNDDYEDLDDNNYDDDLGDWSDSEQTDFLDVRTIDIEAVPMTLTIKRADDRKLSDHNLTAATIDGQEEVTMMTNEQGRIDINNVKLGAVYGEYRIVSKTQGDFMLEFTHDDWWLGSGPEPETLGEFSFDAKFNTLVLYARPVVIEIPLLDKFPEDGSDLGEQDPFPGVSLVSGINLQNIEVTLNGNDILREYNHPESEGDPGKLGQFPNYRQLFLNDVALSTVDSETWKQRPTNLRLIYLPTSDDLDSNNTIDVTLFEDEVENQFENMGTETLPKEFSYP